MMFHNIMLYTLEQIDEVVEFDAEKHKEVSFKGHIPGGNEKPDELTWFQRMVALFFYNHACDVWNEKGVYPDHDVAIIVSVEQLASVFDENVEIVDEAIQKLLDCEIIGIVLLPDGRFAYHFVL